LFEKQEDWTITQIVNVEWGVCTWGAYYKRSFVLGGVRALSGWSTHPNNCNQN